MILSLACSQFADDAAEAIARRRLMGLRVGKRENCWVAGRGKQADLAVYEVEDYREIHIILG